MIQEFSPALRTSSQVEAFRIALQMLGDLCGFGITYFDFDSTGYVKTATEVSSDNSALMRNIARHEHVLEQSITGISRALLHIAHSFGVDLPQEGDLKVMFDDSIITDTFQEKKQDLSEVGVTMSVAEFRAKWYGEPLDVAEERAGKPGAVNSPDAVWRIRRNNATWGCWAIASPSLYSALVKWLPAHFGEEFAK